MDFRLGEKELALKEEIRKFAEAELPPDLVRHTVIDGEFRDFEFEISMSRKLAQRGWLAMSGPEKYGGRVKNAGGTVTSSAVALNIAPQLFTQTTSQGATLTWPEPFILQAASSPAGPYADVPGATSPYVYDALANPPQFFRLRLPSFSLTMVSLPGGTMSITGSGVPGYNFTLQGSTDLRTWVDVGTSPSPCTFVDTEAGLFPQRFYRAVLAH